MVTHRVHNFQTTEPVQVDVHNVAGEVRVTASGQGDARVELTPLRDDRVTRSAIEQATVEFGDGQLLVHCEETGRHIGRLAKIRVSLVVPDGSSVTAHTVSAGVRVDGRTASLEVETANGDVTVEDVDGEARVRTASGDIAVRTVTGDLRVRTLAGTLRCDRVETLRAELVSGDVTVGELGGSAEISTASGDLDIGRVGQDDLTIHTASGNVRVGVAPGAVAHLSVSTLSGSMSNDLPVEESAPAGGTTVNIKIRTLSGDIRIGRARASQPA
jgi:Uncharacterized conserved protein